MKLTEKIRTESIEPLLTPAETAELLGVTVGTLQVWRTTKRYPLPYVKMGRRVMYEPEAVRQFRSIRTVKC